MYYTVIQYTYTLHNQLCILIVSLFVSPSSLYLSKYPSKCTCTWHVHVVVCLPSMFLINSFFLSQNLSSSFFSPTFSHSSSLSFLLTLSLSLSLPSSLPPFLLTFSPSPLSIGWSGTDITYETQRSHRTWRGNVRVSGGYHRYQSI